MSTTIPPNNSTGFEPTTNRTADPEPIYAGDSRPDLYGRHAPCKGCGYDPVESGWVLVESTGGFGPSLGSVECPDCSAIVAFSSTHDWAV